jgi:hypothetical protein
VSYNRHMSDEGKALELFKLVASRTKKKEMDWSTSDLSEDIFESTTGAGFKLKAFPFTIEESDGQPPSLTVYDADGTMIFDITSELEGLSGLELRDFYATVRGCALDIDGKLQAVIDDLTNPQVKVF